MTTEIVKSETRTELVHEESELRQHEQRIHTALDRFRRVRDEVARIAGEELGAIRDGRLYRHRYANWDGYCREVWGWDRVYVHHLIQFAEDARMLSIDTVSHSRALAKLDDDVEAKQAVLDAVKAEHGKVTAALIKEEIARRTQGPVPGQLPAEWAAPIDSLTPSPYRYRTDPPEATKRPSYDPDGNQLPSTIVESLREFGQMQPILVTNENVIITGHRVWEAAKTLGWTHIVVLVKDWDEGTVLRYMAADNGLADKAGNIAAQAKVAALIEELGADAVEDLVYELVTENRRNLPGRHRKVPDSAPTPLDR